MSRKSTAAFTLVELLIAAAISTVVIFAVSGVVSMGLKSFASVSTVGERNIRRVQLVSALEQDLASAMPLNGVKFEGGRDSMSFARLVSPTHSTNATTVVKISWTRDAAGVVVRTLTQPDASIVSESFGPALNFKLNYAGADDGEKREKIMTVTWVDEWKRNKLPGLVRINLGDLSFDVSVSCSNFALDKEDEP